MDFFYPNRSLLLAHHHHHHHLHHHHHHHLDVLPSCRCPQLQLTRLELQQQAKLQTAKPSWSWLETPHEKLESHDP